MTDLKEIERKLLDKWLEDESFINWAKNRSDGDTATWEHYFNLHPEHWELGKIGRTIVLGVAFQEIPTNPLARDRSLKTLLNKLDQKSIIDRDIPKSKKKGKIFSMQKRWMVAASIATLLFTSGIFYQIFLKDAEILLVTQYGEQLNTQLPDGSLITLNANSSLRYFSSNPRKVWIEGEAFFEITKKPETGENFQVVTPDLTVTVLGTSFNVNARNDQTKVFLEEGKVDLETVDPEIDLIKMEPGDLVSYSKKRKSLEDKRNNVSSLQNSSWKVGALIFKDTPLPQALYQIEDIYGIQFVLESAGLKDELISGGVPINNLEATLETLYEVYDILIREDGDRYFLNKEY